MVVNPSEKIKLCHMIQWVAMHAVMGLLLYASS